MIQILGINLDQYSKVEFLEKIKNIALGSKASYITTPNPDIILSAQHDEEYFYILNQADLKIPDGFGLNLSALLAGKKLNRLPGADITKFLLKLATDNKIRVGVVNWQDGLSSAAEIKNAVLKEFSNLQIETFDLNRDQEIDEKNKAALLNFSPQILFCSFGAPYQEKFIYHNLLSWPKLSLAIGVGGSFDFITGRRPRAPKLFQKLGLEWLWRMLKKPSHVKRVFRSIFVFGYRVFVSRFIQPLVYRSNVAIWLYKNEGGKYYTLLLERAEDPGHWQLPQGGRDGEDIEKAGARELKEETHCQNFIIKKSWANLYKYKIKDKQRFGYKGQKQSLVLAEFLGNNEELKNNFWEHRAWKWVETDNILESVHPVRRQATEIYLKKIKEYFNK